MSITLNARPKACFILDHDTGDLWACPLDDDPAAVALEAATRPDGTIDYAAFKKARVEALRAADLALMREGLRELARFGGSLLCVGLLIGFLAAMPL